MRIQIMSIEGTPPLETLAALYNRAFEQFGNSALRAVKPMPNPRPAHALTVIYCLRNYNSTAAHLLAERLEETRLDVLKGRVILP